MVDSFMKKIIVIGWERREFDYFLSYIDNSRHQFHFANRPEMIRGIEASEVIILKQANRLNNIEKLKDFAYSRIR